MYKHTHRRTHVSIQMHKQLHITQWRHLTKHAALSGHCDGNTSHHITVCGKVELHLNWNSLQLLCAGVSICVASPSCVCVRDSRQLLASDRGGVLFVTRTGLSPPPGVGITMIVMAMECEWQAGSHVVAGEQEARTAPVPDISLSFIKTLHSLRTTHSLCCKISPIYFPFFHHLSLSCPDLSFSLLFLFLQLFASHLHLFHTLISPPPSPSLSITSQFFSLSSYCAKHRICFEFFGWHHAAL